MPVPPAPETASRGSRRAAARQIREIADWDMPVAAAIVGVHLEVLNGL
ncbi:putative protein OS=Streptomyces griseomycini OX=66895 GN=FHS37_006788 PE=4 SV=1 [Streptomyces griseomycini]|uniref:Uncharacterized protein n=1 Tax=Streptomyces griseomycini TaxID=66895 RepID=A0A7W7PWK9_9ACTN|nr:hypothetical protein [Streptomyces griseomycini]GGR54741.1 hypothetical protein GCM10015536_70060 [Streptomyces griseomycini]